MGQGRAATILFIVSLVIIVFWQLFDSENTGIIDAQVVSRASPDICASRGGMVVSEWLRASAAENPNEPAPAT